MKSVVVECVLLDGYAVLNADDDLVYKMKDNLNCKIALFSLDEHSLRIKQHCENGGISCVYQDSYIALRLGVATEKVLHVDDLPISFSSTAMFNVTNALAATFATYLMARVPQKLKRHFGSSCQEPSIHQEE